MKKNLLTILALSLGISSFAQIIYTDIADVTLTPAAARETFNIDINGDATVDFTLFAVDSTISAFPVKAIGILFAGSNEAAGTVENIPLGDILKLNALNSGDDVNSTLTYVNNSSSANLIFQGGGLGLHTSILTSGNFINTTNRFIGVHFNIGGSMHFGWIGVDVSAGASKVIIKDFAYESTANTPIKAGDNGISTFVAEKEVANASVYFANNELNIKGISGNYTVSVIDLLGKSIVNTTVSNTVAIQLGSVNNGIYLVQIAKGNALVTKKVYIK